MYTLNEPNIFNLVVNGTFDDCQTIVKEANADADFKKKYKLGAVNSINWARISAQVVYYFYSYLQVAKNNSEKVAYAVPSGNFGNALSAYIASKMGLNIEIIVCTNETMYSTNFLKAESTAYEKEAMLKLPRALQWISHRRQTLSVSYLIMSSETPRKFVLCGKS